MTQVKLTKNELRDQQSRLFQFQKYLPTLQLKKSMLQFEVAVAQMEILALEESFSASKEKVVSFSFFLKEKVSCNLESYVAIQHVEKRYENVAGVDIPIFENVIFQKPHYALFDTPAWTDQAMVLLKEMIVLKEKLSIAKEKKHALDKELRDVSIRVNLFEKVLIPRSEQNISKIRIFLGDQQLAAVAQAKVAKMKIQRAKK
jgi:V/A-type H+-transporting ATPase subunit D